MNQLPKISVVISTFSGERSSNLKEALDSIIEQSYSADEVVLVVDGPISLDQKQVIEVVKGYSTILRVLWLPHNVGRGKARNIGVESCRNPLVAIMDSDDISHYDRFRLTIDALVSNGADLVCSFQREFEDSNGKVLAIKRCPEIDVDIKAALRISCVISNPTILFTKEAWFKVGGFPDYRDCNEDYLFFLRLAKAGASFYCVQKALLNVRVSESQRNRRAGLNVYIDDFIFRRACVKEGHHSLLFGVFIMAVLSVKRLSPKVVRNLLNYFWRKRRFY